MEPLKVSKKTNVKKLAQAITVNVVNFNSVDVQGIGVVSMSKAVKAVAIANQFFIPGKNELVCVPKFTKAELNGKTYTFITLTVEQVAKNE